MSAEPQQESTAATDERKEGDRQVARARSEILVMASEFGIVAATIACGSLSRSVIVKAALGVAKCLFKVSDIISINLYEACLAKLQLNERKYPVHLCQQQVGNTFHVPFLKGNKYCSNPFIR